MISDKVIIKLENLRNSEFYLFLELIRKLSVNETLSQPLDTTHLTIDTLFPRNSYHN